MNVSSLRQSELTDDPKRTFTLRSLLSTSAGYGSAEIAGRIIQFAATFYLARTCTKAEFGAFGFLIAVQQAVALLGQSGIVELLMGEIAHASSPEEQGRIIRTVQEYAFWYRLAWFILATAALMLFSPMNEQLHSPFVLLSVSAGGYLLAKFFVESSSYQIMQSRRLAIYFKVAPIVFMNIAGIIAYQISGNQLRFFFIGVLAGLVLTLLMTRRWSVRPRGKAWRTSHGPSELLMRTAPYMAVAILGWLTGYGNNVVISAVFDAETVAEYTLALTLAMPVFLICNATNQAWYPKFIELSQSWPKDDLNRANAAASAVQLLLAALASLSLLQLYPAFLSLLGGKLSEYSHAVQYTGLLMFGYVSLHLYYRVFLYFLVSRQSGRFLALNAIAGLTGIAISILLMLRSGVIGIYAGFILTNALTGILFSYDASRQWAIRWPVGNLALAAGALGPAIYFSTRDHEVISAIVLNGGSALILCLAWYGLNWKSLRIIRTTAGRP